MAAPIFSRINQSDLSTLASGNFSDVENLQNRILGKYAEDDDPRIKGGVWITGDLNQGDFVGLISIIDHNFDSADKWCCGVYTNTNLIDDPGFDTPGDWVAGTGWAITGSKAVATSVASSVPLYGDPADASITLDGAYLIKVNVTGLSGANLRISLSKSATRSKALEFGIEEGDARDYVGVIDLDSSGDGWDGTSDTDYGDAGSVYFDVHPVGGSSLNVTLDNIEVYRIKSHNLGSGIFGIENVTGGVYQPVRQPVSVKAKSDQSIGFFRNAAAEAPGVNPGFLTDSTLFDTRFNSYAYWTSDDVPVTAATDRFFISFIPSYERSFRIGRLYVGNYMQLSNKPQNGDVKTRIIDQSKVSVNESGGTQFDPIKVRRGYRITVKHLSEASGLWCARLFADVLKQSREFIFVFDPELTNDDQMNCIYVRQDRPPKLKASGTVKVTGVDELLFRLDMSLIEVV